MAKMAKMTKNNGKNGENLRHYGKNGEKMFAIFAIMVKIDGKMAKMAKINGKNGKFFLAIFAISQFRHGENREKNKWRMAMSPPKNDRRKINGKMARMAKINGENGIFCHFRHFTTAKIEKKINGEEPPKNYKKQQKT